MKITLHLHSDFIRHLDTLGDDLIEFDLDDLLDDNRMIAHVWCIEDVQELRPDLSEDQQSEQPWTEKAAASSGKGRKRGG